MGQITPLPSAKDNIGGRLMTLFESVRRRNIRKAQKSGVRSRKSDSLEDLRFLAGLHQENMEAIGGLAKSWDFFRLIREKMTYDQDYCLFIAERNGERIAGLLTFYFGQIAEYITPAIQHESRSYQPNSLLIFAAMKDAAQKGFSYWNWGGTWTSQDSLYDFKKRWGTQDYPYYYYVYSYRDITDLLGSSPAYLLDAYPYFYVIPFDELANTDD
jgi:lipid II:glycine glycyltransferase (peptidoglycan interpeptide bridge formation enzyme)